MKGIMFSILFLSACSLFSAPYNGSLMRFYQPDGSSVDVRIFGTEYYMRAEGLDNYTLVREPVTKWICYASLSEDKSELISTGIVYKGKTNDAHSLRNDLNLDFHLDVSAKAKSEIIRKNKIKLGNENKGVSSGGVNSINGTPVHQVSGSVLGLCIVVDFPDEAGIVAVEEFDSLCNNLNYTNYGNNGSLRSYYADISGGLLDYQNVVFGYYTAPQTFAYYDSLPYATGAKLILEQALHWIDSLGFDFSTLSLNPDSSIMAINLMYTGYPQQWAEGMWFHKGNFSGFSADGVHSNDYNASPANSPLTLATVVHENGHMIGKWPDTYKYDGNSGVDGIGAFDLMCNYGSSINPVPPNPLFRSNIGWGRVVDITGYNGWISDTANSGTCFRYNNPNDTSEFYLLENRMKWGRSAAIDDEGLTIWHIDRNGNNQTFHHEVRLEHANNDSTFQSQACFHNPDYTEFSISSLPPANWYNGDPSGLRVWDIGNIDSVLPYRIGSGAAGPSYQLVFVDISGDDNGNGYIESSESGNLNLTASNIGQQNSGNLVISCTAIGANAGYVTVNTPSIQLGVLLSPQSSNAAFNITLNPSTPIGTELHFRFELTDGNDSIYITRKLIAGIQLIMGNLNSVLCSGLFYDPGYLMNYSDNTDFTTTIFPAINGNMVVADFTSFALEDEPGCFYDYLQIFDGPTDSHPLIGWYCGLNSPGVVTSTDPGGALTFKFHSDGGVTASGWTAMIQCSSPGAIAQAGSGDFAVVPNPSSGKIQIISTGNTGYSFHDVYGRTLFRKHYPSTENFQLDISRFPSGFYFLKIYSGEKQLTRRILLNK